MQVRGATFEGLEKVLQMSDIDNECWEACWCEEANSHTGPCRGLLEDVQRRWGTAGAAPDDWPRLTGLLALAVAQTWLAGGQAERRLLRVLQDLHHQVSAPPVRLQ